MVDEVGKKVSFRDLFELNFSVLVMGNVTLFAKLLPFPASTIIFGRAFFSIFILAIFFWIRGKSLFQLPKKDFFKVLCIGGLFGIHWVTYFHSIQVSTVAIGMLALFTYPFFSSIIEPLFHGRSIDFYSLTLAFLSLVGLAFLVPEFRWENSGFQGVFWGVFSAIVYTIRNVLTKEMHVHYSSSHLLWIQMLGTTLVLFPFSEGKEAMFSEPKYLVYQLLLAGIFTSLAHTLWIRSFSKLSVTSAGIFSMLSPVYGIFSAWFFLGEALPDQIWIGGSVLFLGAILEIYRKSQKIDDPGT